MFYSALIVRNKVKILWGIDSDVVNNIFVIRIAYFIDPSALELSPIGKSKHIKYF